MFLSRYKTNGSLDSSFGTKGVVTTNVAVFKEDKRRKLLQQFNGKLVAMGTQKDNNLSLYRFNANGSTDLTFGNGGRAIADFSTTMQPHSVVLQRDGNIVVAGTTTSTIAVQVKGDSLVEANEKFALLLSQPSCRQLILIRTKVTAHNIAALNTIIQSSSHRLT